MRSPNSAPRGQRGFTLMDVMTASMILSIFILGLGASWVVADRRANALVQRQKAIFIANSEMERLTALYNYTTFGVLGPATTTTYDGTAPFPATRLTYSTLGLSPWYGAADKDFTTTSATTFQSGSEFQVWTAASGVAALNRSYVWIDRAQNVMGRLSWVATNITPSPCTMGSDGCACLNYSGLGSGSCQRIDLFLEYPYRLVSGAATAPGTVQTVSLSSIVGRQSR